MKFTDLLTMIEKRNPCVDGPAKAWCLTKPDKTPTPYIKLTNGKVTDEGEKFQSYADADTAMRKFWNGWQELVQPGEPVIWRSYPSLVSTFIGHYVTARFAVGELDE
jgi:hypothetical protein